MIEAVDTPSYPGAGHRADRVRSSDPGRL